MKLFLSSKGIKGKLETHFFALLGKPAKDIAFCLIENAADPYMEESKGFMYETRNDLEKVGMRMERLDLHVYVNKQVVLLEKLKYFDVVWIGGGNTYYIRWLMKKTGFDNIIRTLVEHGVVYGGGSAGAIVAGPTINYFQDVDEPENAPELINEGLGLTELVVIPHWQNPKYQAKMEGIQKKLIYDEYQQIPITDDQAIVVSGNSWKLVP